MISRPVSIFFLFSSAHAWCQYGKAAVASDVGREAHAGVVPLSFSREEMKDLCRDMHLFCNPTTAGELNRHYARLLG